MFTYVRKLILLLPLLLAVPCQASRWIEIGNAGASTDKVLVDTDSVEKIDEPLALLAATGNVPQNVNFAVRGEVAQIFMAARGIKVLTGHRQQAQSTEAIAAAGLKSTVLVQCSME